MSYYIKQSEPQLWTVGYYTPIGTWYPIEDFSSKELAEEKAALLNGTITRYKFVHEDADYWHEKFREVMAEREKLSILIQDVRDEVWQSHMTDNEKLSSYEKLDKLDKWCTKT